MMLHICTTRTGDAILAASRKATHPLRCCTVCCGLNPKRNDPSSEPRRRDLSFHADWKRFFYQNAKYVLEYRITILFSKPSLVGFFVFLSSCFISVCLCRMEACFYHFCEEKENTHIRVAHTPELHTHQSCTLTRVAHTPSKPERQCRIECTLLSVVARMDPQRTLLTRLSNSRLPGIAEHHARCGTWSAPSNSSARQSHSTITVASAAIRLPVRRLSSQ